MHKNLSFQDLRMFSLFRNLGDEDLGRVLEDVRKWGLEKDEVLLREGDISGSLYFVFSGWLKAEKISSEGRSQVLRFIGPGEVINELSVFSKAPNAMSVVALEEAAVFSISRATIEHLLETNPSFSRGVIQSLSVRIQHLVSHVENLSFYSVETRLARFLLAEAEGNIVTRQSWKTQSEIASRLGTVLDVLNRQMQEFVRRGLIDVQREQIIILNRLDLEKIAGDQPN